MDSITQVTLGAAVGEAILGKKTGYKAAVWGGVLGTLPDLDILANPLLDQVSELYFHRGITHSFFFAIAAAPVIGLGLKKLHKSDGATLKNWTFFVFWIFLTHILIDLPTNYGTQIFQPFTNRPFATDALFIIDPLFTVPILLGVLSAQILRRQGSLGDSLNRAGLIISAVYLLWAHAIKSQVHAVYTESFEQQHGYIDQMRTIPNGPTTFLWSGYIIRQDTVYHAVYYIFDDSLDLEFQKIPRNSSLIDPYWDDRGMEALLWFSRGYYTVETDDSGDLYFYDLRFGREDLYLQQDAGYVWSNRLLIDEENNAYSFEQSLPSFDVRSRNLKLFWDRIWGQ